MLNWLTQVGVACEVFANNSWCHWAVLIKLSRAIYFYMSWKFTPNFLDIQWRESDCQNIKNAIIEAVQALWWLVYSGFVSSLNRLYNLSDMAHFLLSPEPAISHSWLGFWLIAPFKHKSGLNPPVCCFWFYFHFVSMPNQQGLEQVVCTVFESILNW